LVKDVSAIKQLELVKQLQTEWSDNAVSCTVYYRKEELSGIKEWLRKNYKSSVKSISFLLHTDHNFNQAPYIETTEDVYKKAVAEMKTITKFSNGGEQVLLDNLECSSGACPIK
jgi:ribonucleoside-triphosphate reductase